jgi:hypothetical protein
MVIRAALWRTVALVTAAMGSLVCGACGPAVLPLRAELVPSTAPARDTALRSFGGALFAALREGSPETILFDDLALRSLLDGAGSSRATAMRQTAGPSLRAETHALTLALRGTSYVGICVQRSSAEPAGGALGLSTDAWVVERVLVVAQHPRAGRIAGWVEGTFVFTSRGFGAVAIDSVEAPRVNHSDLELASCEMASGLDDP